MKCSSQWPILQYILSDADGKGQLVVLQGQRVGWFVLRSADASFIAVLSAAVLQEVFQTFEL